MSSIMMFIKIDNDGGSGGALSSASQYRMWSRVVELNRRRSRGGKVNGHLERTQRVGDGRVFEAHSRDTGRDDQAKIFFEVDSTHSKENQGPEEDNGQLVVRPLYSNVSDDRGPQERKKI